MLQSHCQGRHYSWPYVNVEQRYLSSCGLVYSLAFFSFLTHTCADQWSDKLKGILFKSPEFSLCSSLVSAVCIVDASYFGLPGLSALSSQLREPLGLCWGSLSLWYGLKTLSRRKARVISGIVLLVSHFSEITACYPRFWAHIVPIFWLFQVGVNLFPITSSWTEWKSRTLPFKICL